MADAYDIQGDVHKNSSVTPLARVIGADGSAITQADLSSAKYTAYLLDEHDPDVKTAISGHTDVNVVIADTIFDTLQTDAIWDTGLDATGYNFKHVLDVSTTQIFTIAGRYYLIVFTLTPTSGQIILVRCRLKVI